MADDDSRPSLEPPRLFGRRKDTAPDPVDDEPTTIFEVDEADEAEPVEEPEHFEEMAREIDDRDDAAEPEATEAPVTRRPRPRLPVLDGRVTAAISGLLSGLVLIGLTAGFLKACSEVRDSTSCGQLPGSILLVVVLVVTILVGRTLLALGRVPEPGSTSFLAVGLVGVVSLLFFVDVLDTWPMLVALPLMTALAFVISWWMTTTYVDPEPES